MDNSRRRLIGLDNKRETLTANALKRELIEKSGFIQQLSLQGLQLALLSLAIYQFNIEVHLGLPKLMIITSGAFVVNAILPKNFRLSFFFFASLIPIFYFFSWYDASLLIGTCHLPIALNYRKLGVIALGGGLALCKYLLAKGLFVEGIPFSSHLVSVLGTMFMFRMIIYLYELKYEKEASSIWQRLTYFFMLPNICFPIFPIIDYKTFKRTYYDQPDLEVYQRGINLILLGVIQLLIYRVAYYLTPAANSVDGFWVLLRYLSLSYFSLIRLNGILNIAVGLLRLFGFNLPDIFNYMFLARGFDDYWRRLNIYWKDFLVKIIYYPIYFKLRKKGTTYALVIGTMSLFLFNWFFHVYQWFWVLGEFPVRPTEMFSWLFLGSFVLFSILRKQEKSVVPPEDKWRGGIVKMGAVLLTFGGMCIIYSLYISPSLKIWVRTLGQISGGNLMDWSLFLLAIFALLMIGAGLFKAFEEGRFQKIGDYFYQQNRLVFLNICLLGLILFSTSSWVGQQVQNITGFSTQPFINHHLNLGDQRKQFDGYYEELMFADNFSSPLWQMEHKKPSDWENINELGILRNENGMTSLEPNREVVFKKAKLTTNRWGHRDQDYEKLRPENTMRFAIVGGSAEMGAGVTNEQVFEQLTENKLNAVWGRDTAHFEMINFAVSGMSVIRNLEKIRQDVFDFQPQYLVLFTHKQEERHVLKSIRWLDSRFGADALSEQTRENISWFAELKDLLKKENIQYDPGTPIDEIERGGWAILDWGYEYIKKMCDDQGVKMVMVFLPDVLKSKGEPYLPFQKIAEEKNITFINLDGIFADYQPEELQIAPWDNHCNALGHQLIADELYLQLVQYLNLE